ncbi:MAG: AGE family epimerase/isomerase [Bryobacterales bacterium]|nr:AGE family epimerase/isomerase [Bryobacterales bacterium]
MPFWMKHSLDEEHGGYFTCVERDGRLYDSRKYLWLNGRELWMLAKLYNECPDHPERGKWLEAARKGAAFLRKHARDAQGRCYFSLSREGQPTGYQRKPYAAVFLCIGYHEYWKATGEEWALKEARDLFWRMREWIANPALMDRPKLAGAAAFTQLADWMVQASTALELAAADPDPRYREVMAECLDAILLRHLDAERNLLLENVAPDGGKRFDMPEGRLFCPGHSVEVCWFLLDMLEYHPDAERQRQVLDILEASLEAGWDKQHGGLTYFVDVEGREMLQLEAGMKLWWPHTEALYACVYALKLTGERRWARWLGKVEEYSWATFVDTVHGEWFGYCDRTGKPTHLLKGNNYKGCFHVPRALWLSIRKIDG